MLFAGGIATLFATPGADCYWLVAFGRYVADGHLLARAVPYATAPSAHTWANVPVLSELAFAGAWRIAGSYALVALQSAAVFCSLATLAWTARHAGAADFATAAVVVLVAVGAAPALLIVRAQLFSLILFPLLLALLTRQTDRPTRAVWTVVPMISIWSMLHGGVLVGVAVAVVWALLARFPRHPWEAAGLMVAMPLAVCLTPALARTPAYYADVIESEAVRRGYGLWAPLTWSAWDIVLVGAAVALGAAAVWGRMPTWAAGAAVLLAVATARAPRDGIWLLMVLSPAAARSLRLPALAATRLLVTTAAALAAAVTIVGLVTAGSRSSRGDQVVRRATALGHRLPVLGEPLLAEKVAAFGGRVWIANPVEAFSRRAQSEWLDWLQRRTPIPPSLERRTTIVLVDTTSAVGRAVARTAGYRLLLVNGGIALYVRAPHA